MNKKLFKYKPSGDLISEMGYRDDSPFNQLPSIDIHTPTGLIDMSATGQPLIANGRYLPAYSGQHQFDTNVVTETPAMQNGGNVDCGKGYIWDFELGKCIVGNDSVDVYHGNVDRSSYNPYDNNMTIGTDNSSETLLHEKKHAIDRLKSNRLSPFEYTPANKALIPLISDDQVEYMKYGKRDDEIKDITDNFSKNFQQITGKYYSPDMMFAGKGMRNKIADDLIYKKPNTTEYNAEKFAEQQLKAKQQNNDIQLNFRQNGGELTQEQLKNLNISKMMKNFDKKYQTGGYTPRLVQTVPQGYTPVNGVPNTYHNPQLTIGQNTIQVNGPQASNEDWNAYLQTPAGIKWKQNQQLKTQSDDYVYTQPQTPIVPPNVRDNFATRATENQAFFNANHQAAGRVMYPIRKTNDITQNGNGIYADSDVYYQPMNGLGKDIGEGKVIANTDFNNNRKDGTAFSPEYFRDYKYPVKPINPINTTNPTDIANVKPLKKGGYINKAGRYVHKDGVTTSKPGLWSNVYMKNKKELGGVIVPKYQLGTNNFNPIGSNILPGTNTAPDKSLCPPGFAFIGGQCLPLQSAPEANVTGTTGILPMAKTDYVTQRYNTDAKFAKKYDDSIDKYESDEEDRQDKLDSDKSDNRIALKMGVLGANAIAGIAGTMYDNNYRLKNARKIQADTEYNPSFSYGSNDYGVAKMGGTLKYFANGGNLDDFDFLYRKEDEEDDAKRVTAEDIAAAKVNDDKYAAIAKENDQLKADAQNQQNSDLAMGVVNGDGYKRKMQQGNNELDYSGATGDIPTTGSGTMIGSKEYTNAWNQYANNNLGSGLNNVKAYYKSKGYEPEFISGVLGNIHAESNGRSNVNEVGGGGGYGLFQHTGVRRTQLVDYANSHNMNPADPIAQAMFAEQEPGFKNAYTAFQNSPDKSPGRAAVLFEKKFERAGIKRYDARIGAANSIYQTFKLGGEYEVSDVELQDLIRKGIQFQMI